VGNRPVQFSDPTGLYEWPKNIANEAEEDSRNSNLPGTHNGAQDAYRHCLASCLMTQENGEFATFMLGQGNEVKGDIWGQPKCERDMDTENNMIGSYMGSLGGDCRSKCRSALDNGVLTVNPNLGSGGY